MTLHARDTFGEPDLDRMRRERFARVHEQIVAADLDAMLLLRASNVEYVTGVALPICDGARASLFRTAAVVARGDPFPHVYAMYPEGVPEELPADHVHPPLWPERDGRRAVELLHGRVAVDDLTAPMWRLLSGVELRDAGGLLGRAKITKTADELRCIRAAQHVNEAAMADVHATLRPGIRTAELTGCFLRRAFELGATGNAIDPIWEAMPGSVPAGSWPGALTFPAPPSDRFVRHGDVIWIDTGLQYHGYASDFGRTWLVGSGGPARPTVRQADQAARWRAIVDAALAVVKPGATGGDLTRAATAALPAEAPRPWLDQFYLAHGIGTDSAEMPLIGTDLGPAFDDSIVLAPGMVLVFEPVVWDDGACGYRAEDIVAVTDDGWVALSDRECDPFS